MSATISIEVDPETARAYNAASAERKQKLDALLTVYLNRAMHSDQSLAEIMSSMSRTAQERGLTPEILEQILREP